MGNGETTVGKREQHPKRARYPMERCRPQRSRQSHDLRDHGVPTRVRVLEGARAKALLEVHQKGRSIVWSGVREPAESYVEQLQGYLLLATLEKAQ